MQSKRINLYKNFRKGAKKKSDFDAKYPDFSAWEDLNFKNTTTVKELWNKSLKATVGKKTLWGDTLDSFYKTFACDLQWAKDGGFCSTTPSPSPTSGPTPTPTPTGGGGTTPTPVRTTPTYTDTNITENDIVNGSLVKKGMKGDIVRKIQEHLNKHGASLVVDGKFGPRTKSAVENFQSSKGLKVDGVVGPKTWAELIKPKKVVPPPPETYDAEEEITIGDETSSSGSAISSPLDAIQDHKINYMKNKLFVPKEEKLKILEQHNFLRNAIFAAKNIITEQTQIQGEELIKKAIQLGCRMVAGASPFTNKAKTQRWYQKTADYDQTKGAFKTGDFLQFSLAIDSRNPDSWTVTVIPTTVDANGQTVPQRTSDGKIVRKGPFKWTCKALVDDLNKEVTYDVERFKEQQWQTKEQAMTNKSIDFTNPNSYETKVVNGVQYFRNKTSAQIGTSEIKPQKEILDYWRTKFGASEEFKEGDDPKQKTWGFKMPYGLGWKEYQIPDKEKQFSENIRIFLSPTKYKTVTQGSSTEVGTVAGQLKVSERDCRKNAETYYEAYLSDSEFTPDLELLKKNLNACHKRYCRPRENQGKCGKLGGLFGSQLDELLDFFKGMGDYKGQRIGRQERWHLEQK